MTNLNNIASKIYQERRMIGFTILLNLFEKNVIDKNKLDDGALTMIKIWTDMKYNRYKPTKKQVLASHVIALLNEIPGSKSKEICSENIFQNLKSRGQQLIEYGYVVIYLNKKDEWTCKRTIIGDEVLRITGYSNGQ